MDRLEIAPDLWVDARRALWMEHERTLVVADLHLGYAWAQRRRGALLPLADVEDAAARLLALQQEYRPETLVFLGDLVHGRQLGAPVGASLGDLLGRLAVASQLVLTLGNHDGSVPGWIAQAGLPLRCEPAWRTGAHLLLHGDRDEDARNARPTEAADVVVRTLAADVAVRAPRERSQSARPAKPRFGAVGRKEGLVIMGHEHPMIVLGDDVATGARCPCFLVGEHRLMVPAFSRWAAGVVAGREPFMSELARTSRWHAAVAILGERLLRLPWKRRDCFP